MAEFSQKRLPSIERKVDSIAQNDIRVSIIGTIVDMIDGKIVVDDGTGKVNVSVDQSPTTLDMNKIVRIMGRVIPMDGGVEIEAEVVQDMSSFDIGLFKTVKEAEQ